jgi:hypothetical protein
MPRTATVEQVIAGSWCPACKVHRGTPCVFAKPRPYAVHWQRRRRFLYPPK